MGYIRDSSPSAMIEAAYEHHHINARYLNCGYSEARGRLSAPEIFKDFPDRDALATSIFCSCVTNTLRTTRTPILRPYPARSLNGPAEPYKVAKIVSTAFHVESLNRDDYKKLFNLVRRAIQYTEEQIDLLCNQITEQLQKRIA
jgi:hypothetical protein